MKKVTKKILLIVGPAILIAGTILGATAWAPEQVFPWVFPIAIPFGVIVVLAVLHGFRLPDEYVIRWSKAHGIEITDENWPTIHRYLRRGRRIRTVGALAGYLTYSIWTMATPNNQIGWNWLTATFGGYLLGAAAAEVWAFRPEPGARRAASLSPRRITDYVPRYSIVTLRLTTIAIVLLAATWSIIPLGFIPRGIRHPHRPDLAIVLSWTVAAVVIWALVEATARRIVRRAQPITTPELVAADDAIRSTAMHGLIGAGLALVLGILSSGAGDWMRVVDSDLHPLFTIVTIVAWWGGLFAWLRLGVDQPWIVRRSQPQPQREVVA